MTGQQLKNSILQMAVQGKLVPQDQNDEPASVLLERIRIEKEQLIKEGKIKKDKNPSYIFRGDDNLPYEKVGKNEPVCIADEVPFEIPESWEWVRFSSVIELQSGQDMTPDKYNSVQKGIPYLTGASNIENGKIIINRWTESGKAFAYKGDLLITCKGTVGTMTILEEDMVHIARQIMAIKSNHSIEIEYIKLVLETLVATLKAAAKSMIPGISRDDILMSFLPLPPHKEQIRIVDFYKSMIPFIDEYTEKELMLQDLNQSFTELLKKSILQDAVHGKLVPQDPNDEPASVLLERIRAEKEALIKAGKIKRDKNESVIFRRDNSHYEKRGSEEICIDDDIPFDCPQSWAWCRMGDLISVRGGKRLPAGAQLTTEKTDHVYIRVTDMKNGTVDLSDLHYISDDIYDSIKNYIIRSEDVYIVIVGSTIGKAGIVPYELDGMNLTENAARLTPILVNRDYLLLAIQTDLLQKQFIDRTNQVGQPKLALERLKTALIPLPPLNEQQRIIETYRTLVPIIQNA